MPRPQRLVEKGNGEGTVPAHWLFLLVPLPTFPNARARLRQDRTCSMDNPESQYWKSQVLFRKAQASKGASTSPGQGGQGASSCLRIQAQLQSLFLSSPSQTCLLSNQGELGASGLQSWLPPNQEGQQQSNQYSWLLPGEHRLSLPFPQQATVPLNCFPLALNLPSF